MLRDYRQMRRNAEMEEIENVPSNPNTSEQEMIVKSKFERTPVKPNNNKGKNENSTHPLRTPERGGGTGALARNRFGFLSLNEGRDEGRSEMGSYISQVSKNGGSLNLTPRVGGPNGRGYSGFSESTSTQSTPTKSVSKPPNPGYVAPLSSSRHVGSARGGGNYSALSTRRFSVSNVVQSCVVNSAEVPHFDLKEDPSFWMDHNVQVILRVRPLNNFERSTNGYNRCVKQENSQSIAWLGQPETRFTFDHVACETVDQEMLFRMAGLPMVENCLSGYNSCMFAYGQTGSGKTYTMLGEMEDLEFKPSPHRGMTPRIFEFLFARIRAEEESRSDENLKYSCRCSFLEIYNEQITDLLDPSATNLLLREDVKKGVYVENLSEFEVHTVADVVRLLIQGSSNRKVAATNMNRESSRSHSVFTCVIECNWERDSATNLRFARLNLVDLAGSERQKSSGAEGERLKEAANINKSLSSLGHVIMLLVDIANGRPRHIPYRDSRLTFLLQDSLGGNSKTMIIANISPSVCCAAETLNTLKFAQRAKLIQNNAVVNEDSSGDVAALQNQIWLLKEELSTLKRQNVSRVLAFDQSSMRGLEDAENKLEGVQSKDDDLLGCESKGSQQVSSKQIKSMERMLGGAMRREQMAENSVKKLEAEIEQLNRLVHQREEESKCTKMMLKFREDKIQRIESQLGGLQPADTYLLEENAALSEEIQLLRSKADKNPEVTRFALENIRLLEQLRQYQDFYEEGEREILMKEISDLRSELIRYIDSGKQQHNPASIGQDASTNGETASLRTELAKTLCELNDCRSKLKSCLESNAKLSREMEDLQALLRNNNVQKHNDHDPANVAKEQESPPLGLETFSVEKCGSKLETAASRVDEIVNLELELDILKIMLKEEKVSCANMEERASSLTRDVQLAEERAVLINTQYEEVKQELKDAKSVIEALESQQILSINEVDDLKNLHNHYSGLLHKKDREISALREQKHGLLSSFSCAKRSECKESPLQAQLKRMQASLDKARVLNMSYQTDHASQRSHEEEMDEIRRQAEAETAEVIVSLQEELSILQHNVEESHQREREAENRLLDLESQMQGLHEALNMTSKDNEALCENLKLKDMEMKSLTDDWESLTSEIEAALVEGHEALSSAFDQIDSNSSPFSDKRGWISERLGKMIRNIAEKESTIEELHRSLEDATGKANDMEHMLLSLRGAAMAMTESHQHDCIKKEEEIKRLMSELSRKESDIAQLEGRMALGCVQMAKASTCATASLIVVNRFSETSSDQLDALMHMDMRMKELNEVIQKQEVTLHEQASAMQEAHKQIEDLQNNLQTSVSECTMRSRQLHEQERNLSSLQKQLEENDEIAIAETKEMLDDFKMGVSGVRSSMSQYLEKAACDGLNGEKSGDEQETNKVDFSSEEQPQAGFSISTDTRDKDVQLVECKNLEPNKNCNDNTRRDATIALLRKEIESALASLKDVQVELARLSFEKEAISMSEKRSRQGMHAVITDMLSLQASLGEFEKQCDSKLLDVDQKLHKVEDCVQEAKSSWWQTKESLEFELVDAKATTAQKSVEASCLLARIEETQETMQEADMMINGLMIANETMKLEIEDFRNMNTMLCDERDDLLSKVQKLHCSTEEKDEKYKDLEEQFKSDVSKNMTLVEDLESLVTLLQQTSEDAFMSLTNDFNSLKSQLQGTMKLMHSSLEETSSEIFVKDSAVSVLHLCHMGALSESLTSLDAENGQLQHELCQSNAVLSTLRMKSEKELDMCRTLEAKLLADITNSFDHISNKELEAKELSVKVSRFTEELAVLQRQEELLLETSKTMASELAILMKELDQNSLTVMRSLSEKEQLLKINEEAIKSQAEYFTLEVYAKDLEIFVVASELQQLADQHAYMAKEKIMCCSALDNLTADVVTLMVASDLKEPVLNELKTEVNCLRTELVEVKGAEANLLLQQHELKEEIKCLSEILQKKEEDHTSLQNKIEELKSNNCSLLNGLQEKDSELDSSVGCIDILKKQNCRLQDDILSLESKILCLEKDLEGRRAELEGFHRSQSSTAEALCRKSQDLDSFTLKTCVLQEENLMLREELQSVKRVDFEALETLKSKVANCVYALENSNLGSWEMLEELNENMKLVLQNMSQDSFQNQDVLSGFIRELEIVDSMAKEVVSENFSLREELFRKEEVLNGLLFDMRLLQEAAANSKDQKDAIKQLMAALESAEEELSIRANELDEVDTRSQELEMRVKEQGDTISTLESDLEKANQSMKHLSDENMGLRSHAEEIMAEKSFAERELSEKTNTIDSLENELLEMGTTLGQMNDLVESLKISLDEVSSERDQLQKEMVILEEKVQTAHALAEENEAIAAESQEIAESRRIYVEEKEEEVKLLETSVQELDSTISVLENKVDILKGETERQRLQREELELELHALKKQMHNVESADADVKRHLDEKARNLQDAMKRMKILEKELANKDTEIGRCKAHISELTVYAEAQASEYKRKFKELEAMVEQVKADEVSSNERLASSNAEKNTSKGRGSLSPFKAKGSSSPFKPRGSGSPFKCIGLGLSHQLKSEKDEELSVERVRIEELEALAASRQKEIFMLNARLAAAESMTHDVIRDLLGVKQDMSSCATMLDKHHIQKLAEKVQFHSIDSEDQEVKRLRMQLTEFIEERQGWLEEIDRKQSELLAVQNALEKHRQQEKMFADENEVLKTRVTELEGEVRKLSDQQNLQHRIHHHAKIKEENSALKTQNEDLTYRLMRAQSLLQRLREQLAHSKRTSNGRSRDIDFDEEQRLKKKLKEVEKEKLHLAQTVLGLCTSILKTAGITKPTPEINHHAAEEALEQLGRRINSLQREIDDVRTKNRITNERVRLAELKSESSPFSARSEDNNNRQTPRRGSQTPFFSAVDR